MNVRHPGVLHSFSIKNIFYKMDLRLFYFDEAIHLLRLTPSSLGPKMSCSFA